MSAIIGFLNINRLNAIECSSDELLKSKTSKLFYMCFKCFNVPQNGSKDTKNHIAFICMDVTISGWYLRLRSLRKLTIF